MSRRRVKKRKVVIKGTGAPAEPIIEGMVPLRGWVIIGKDPTQDWNGWKVYAFEPDHRSSVAVTITQGHDTLANQLRTAALAGVALGRACENDEIRREIDGMYPAAGRATV